VAAGAGRPGGRGSLSYASNLTRVRFEYKSIDHAFHDHLQAGAITG
jgi:hypothetical protein